MKISCRKSFFTEDSKQCQRCELHTTYDLEQCDTCERLRAKHMIIKEADEIWTCLSCKPELANVECSLCHVVKTIRGFKDNLGTILRKNVKRCIACHTCQICHNNFLDNPRGLSPNTTYCQSCYAQHCPKREQCEVCTQLLPRQAFCQSQLDKKDCRNKTLRCEACMYCSKCKERKRPESFQGNSSECLCCHTQHICDVCGETKDRAAFNKSQIHNAKNQHVNLRCDACMNCSKCKKRKRPESFQGHSSECVSCHTQHICDVCGETKDRAAFSESQIHNAKNQNVNLRCDACMTCSQCKQRKRPQNFNGNIHVCVQCEALAMICDSCDKQKGIQEFEPIMKRRVQEGKRIVCKECAACGFTTQDQTRYRCIGGHEGGKTLFSINDIKDAKQRGTKQHLICMKCKEKLQLTEKNMKSRKAWKCKCPNQTDTRLEHTNEKCPLKGTRPGEKRWPGCNNNVTEEDYMFWLKVCRTRKE